MQIAKKKKLLLINKCELMPKSVSKEKFVSFLANYYNMTWQVEMKPDMDLLTTLKSTKS